MGVFDTDPLLYTTNSDPNLGNDSMEAETTGLVLSVDIDPLGYNFVSAPATAVAHCPT